MTENGIIVDGENRSLSISINEETFSDLLMKFLGKKQTLGYINYKDNFTITLHDLTQFHYYLVQKIEKEQFINIVNLNTVVEYDDFTQDSFNGIDKLETFNDLRNLIPISITLTWDLVLQFPTPIETSRTIEKQKISLSFNSLSMANDKSEIKFKLPSEELESFIKLDIEFTNQAWGIEILNLFKNHIHSLIQKEPKPLKFAKFLKRYVIKESLFMLLLSIMLLFIDFRALDVTSFKDQMQVETVSKVFEISKKNQISSQDYLLALFIIDKKAISSSILNTIDSEPLKKVLDSYLTQNNRNNNNNNHSLLYLLVLPLIYIILKIYVSQTRTYYMDKSFLLLTKEANKIYKTNYENTSKTQYFSIVAFMLAIVTSLIATFIYQLFY